VESRILGWTLGSKEIPRKSQHELAERIVVHGAPDLAALLNETDVVAAREVLDMARWPRFDTWRMGTLDKPSEDEVARAVRLLGKYTEGASVVMASGYYADDLRKLLDAARKHGMEVPE
jgi:hypothetical protein